MRGKCTPRLFKGRVIGAPVARANIPCEALGAGLQSLKLPPPFPARPPSLPAASTYPGGLPEWSVSPREGEEGNNQPSTHQLPTLRVAPRVSAASAVLPMGKSKVREVKQLPQVTGLLGG